MLSVLVDDETEVLLSVHDGFGHTLQIQIVDVEQIASSRWERDVCQFAR